MEQKSLWPNYKRLLIEQVQNYLMSELLWNGKRSLWGRPNIRKGWESLLHTLVLRWGLAPKFCFGSIIGIAMGLSRIDTLSCLGLPETKRFWFQTILIGSTVRGIGNLSTS